MTYPLKSSILLIGCGKMGSALLQAWLAFGVKPEFVTVVEPGAHAKAFPVEVVASSKALPVDLRPDIVVLAVKPQSMDQALAEIPESIKKAKPLYLSIAAGKTLAYFQQQLGDVPVVRAMPNTPALIGDGMTGLCANAKVTGDQRRDVGALLETVGDVIWVDESKMDAVTALSGSGPAYVFYFIDALAQAGMKLGLDEDTARYLAIRTVSGSAELAVQSEESPEQLRKNVTSPGGTTEAALKVAMKDDAFVSLIERMLLAAAEHSKTLSS